MVGCLAFCKDRDAWRWLHAPSCWILECSIPNADKQSKHEENGTSSFILQCYWPCDPEVFSDTKAVDFDETMFLSRDHHTKKLMKSRGEFDRLSRFQSLQKNRSTYFNEREAKTWLFLFIPACLSQPSKATSRTVNRAFQEKPSLSSFFCISF